MKGAGKDYVWGYVRPSWLRRIFYRVRWLWKTVKNPALRKATAFFDTKDIGIRAGRRVARDQTGKGNDLLFGSNVDDACICIRIPGEEALVEGCPVHWKEVEGIKRFPSDDSLIVPDHPDLPAPADGLYRPSPEHTFDPNSVRKFEGCSLALRIVERDGVFTLEQLRYGEVIAAVDLPNEKTVVTYTGFGYLDRLELDWDPCGPDGNWSFSELKDPTPFEAYLYRHEIDREGGE